MFYEDFSKPDVVETGTLLYLKIVIIFMPQQENVTTLIRKFIAVDVVPASSFPDKNNLEITVLMDGVHPCVGIKAKDVERLILKIAAHEDETTNNP